MAQRARSVNKRKVEFLAILLALGGLSIGLGAILTLLLASSDDGAGGITLARVFAILKSASLQASLSVLCSGVVAIFGAVSLARMRHLKFYLLLKILLGVAVIVPSTVAAIGLVAVWGRSGAVAELCHALSNSALCSEITIFGLHGVILAHMFLNIPLMILVFLPILESIPGTHWRVAKHLGMRPLARFLLIEWQALRPALIGVGLLVFLLCFTSFALVLMLGGGPRVTTLEVEIYSAIRFEHDLKLAAGLSLIQFTCAAVLVLLLARLAPPLHRTETAPNLPSPFSDAKYWDGFILIGLSILIALPLAMIVLATTPSGLSKALLNPSFLPTLITSLSIASLSALIATFCGLILAAGRARLIKGWQSVLLDSGVMLYLVIPSIVLGTSAFILLRELGDAFAYAFGVVLLANILLVIPFAVRILLPRLRLVFHQHDRVAQSLGIRGWHYWHLLTLPTIKQELGIVLGLGAALSVGDLGVIALFASNDFRTLPWLLYQSAGRYDTEQAIALALILLLVAVVLLFVGRILPHLIWRRSAHA